MTHDRYPSGTILAGKFRIDRLLGRGGMGAVYAASHVGLGQRVAIKLLMDDAARSPEATARFAQEAQIVSRLSSPHVVRVHDVGRSEWGEPFIVMELCEGRDLATLVTSPATLSLVHAVDLVLEAAVGVAAAHAAGLVHRDLKPANLFLARQPDRTEIVKVLDFGLSKNVRGGDVKLTQTATSFGTPQYMAPEQIMSAKHVDARCDQHALGMILFELITKRPPFVASTAAALTVTIVTKPAPSARAIRPDVPRALDEALLRAMAKRPSDRYPDLGAFARAIAPFGGPKALPSVSIIERTLESSVVGAARVDDPASVGDELATMPRTPSVMGVSSGNIRARPSLIFWVLAALTFALAFGATMLLMTVPRPRLASSSGAAALSASPSDANSAIAPAASSEEAPTPRGTEATRATATDSAAEAPSSPIADPTISASAARRVRRPPSSSAHPTPHETASPHDPNDPINVFGRSP